MKVDEPNDKSLGDTTETYMKEGEPTIAAPGTPKERQAKSFEKESNYIHKEDTGAERGLKQEMNDMQKAKAKKAEMQNKELMRLGQGLAAQRTHASEALLKEVKTLHLPVQTKMVPAE